MKPVRVLVVDDDPDIRANLFDILKDVGNEVDVAADGEEALRLVREKPYDVALLDLRLPGMDGVELYRRIKEIRAGTVAIIVSAYAAGESGRAARQEGAWEILPKPVDFPRMLAVIEQAVQRPMVIVVDDDSEMCRSLWDSLNEREYRVCLAHDLKQAKARLTERQYDLALVDMKLPDADGVEALRLIRQVNPEVRVLVITGWRTQMQKRVDEAMAEGADAVCYKPFDMGALVQTVEHLAHRSKPRGEVEPEAPRAQSS